MTTTENNPGFYDEGRPELSPAVNCLGDVLVRISEKGERQMLQTLKESRVVGQMPQTEIVRDEEGYTRMPLVELFQLFGPDLQLASAGVHADDLPIDPNIRFVTNPQSEEISQ